MTATTTTTSISASPSKADDGYYELASRARQAGLFERSTPRAAARVAVIGPLYLAGWLALVIIGNSWYQMFVAVYLAVMFGQVAFLGHDVGHRQFFRSRRANRIVGLACGNLCTGVSYSYWVDKHNQHHAHPNVMGADPDVGPGVIAWTSDQAATRTGLSRLITRYQAVLFFPLTCLEAFNLQVASVRHLKRRPARSAWTEAALLAAHFGGQLGAIFLVLSPLRAVSFFLVQQGLFGLYLGCAFAPNHKGMVIPSPGDQLGFVRRQVTTARNVKGGRALTLAFGGLNYQIEHHLFPTMPMANLRRCQRIVREHCIAHGIDYCETTLLQSYIAALRHLKLAGAPVRG